jgi:hypothetical protein
MRGLRQRGTLNFQPVKNKNPKGSKGTMKLESGSAPGQSLRNSWENCSAQNPGVDVFGAGGIFPRHGFSATIFPSLKT